MEEKEKNKKITNKNKSQEKFPELPEEKAITWEDVNNNIDELFKLHTQKKTVEFPPWIEVTSKGTEIIQQELFIYIDENYYILSVKHGIFKISTDELILHNPQYKSTIQIPCSYVENASLEQAPHFAKFLDDITRACDKMKQEVLANKGLSVNERLRVVANIDVFCVNIKLDILKPIKAIEGMVVADDD